MKTKKINEFKKDYKTIRNIFGIYALLCLIIYIIGFIYAASSNFEIAGKLFYYSSTGLVIPIGILVMIVVIMISVFLINTLFNKIKILYYVNIISIIAVITFFFGIYILINNAISMSLYEEDKVKVIEVKNRTLVIDYETINHGDNAIMEIKKPFYAMWIQPGDTINVRYMEGLDDMHYVISTDSGLSIILISIVVQHVIVFIDLIALVIVAMKEKRKKKNA